MTTEEFSNLFDTLLNSYNESSVSILLDEYEKSVFLTQAQEDLVISLYNGKNQYGDSFESTEEIRRYLNDLIKTSEIIDKQLGKGVSVNSVFFELPTDLMFITYESVDIEDNKLGCKDGKYIDVIPVTQDEYLNIKKNPFKGPNKRRVLRLDAGNNKVELVSDYTISKYLVRYLSKPEPIILTDLPNDLSIDNINIKTDCKLNPVLHKTILENAVRLALTSKSITGK